MNTLTTSSLRRQVSESCSCLCSCTRKASTSSHRIRPSKTWILPNFAAAKRSTNLPPAKPMRFENKVSLPNNTTLTILSTTPRPNIAITRDTSNHPLWAFPSSSQEQALEEDEAGRLGKFARKFQSSSTPSIIEVQDQQPVKKGSVKALKEDVQPVSTNVETMDATMDMFDLTLEGETFEESKHQVVEEQSKKGKKGQGKKGGKK